MAKFALTVAALMLSIQSADARPCIPHQPTYADQLELIAAHGVLIRGEIIQPFDLERRQPTVVRANEIFLGDDHPRDFLIHSQFIRPVSPKRRPGDPIIRTSCGPFRNGLEKPKFDRLILVPAEFFPFYPAGDKERAETVGKWVALFWTNSWIFGDRLEALLDRADTLGRLRAPPPLSRDYGDCSRVPAHLACIRR